MIEYYIGAIIMFDFTRIQYSAIVLFVISAIYIQQGCSVKLPKTFKRCHVSAALDNKPNECLRSAIEGAIVELSSEAHFDLGVATLDPLTIERIYIEKGESSPVAIKLDYINNTLTGVSTTKVLSATGKVSSSKDFKLHFEVIQSKLILYGPYTIVGRVLILPIQGKGMSNMTLLNARIAYDITAQQDIRNGKEYLKLSKFHMSIKPERLHINLNNLFNGNKALGDNMNNFLNENWKDIYEELQDSVEKAFSSIFQVFASRILERIQYKNIFISE